MIIDLHEYSDVAYLYFLANVCTYGDLRSP